MLIGEGEREGGIGRAKTKNYKTEVYSHRSHRSQSDFVAVMVFASHVQTWMRRSRGRLV